ncbi:MAG: hypothetical protein AABX04_03305 [Nanoarchaeota archaeon]
MVKESELNESWLVKIPVLGYFFRKTAENREALERTLKTGKETTGETKETSFLWLFGITSDKTFRPLESKRIKKE